MIQIPIYASDVSTLSDENPFSNPHEVALRIWKTKFSLNYRQAVCRHQNQNQNHTQQIVLSRVEKQQLTKRQTGTQTEWENVILKESLAMSPETDVSLVVDKILDQKIKDKTKQLQKLQETKKRKISEIEESQSQSTHLSTVSSEQQIIKKRKTTKLNNLSKDISGLDSKIKKHEICLGVLSCPVTKKSVHTQIKSDIHCMSGIIREKKSIQVLAVRDNNSKTIAFPVLDNKILICGRCDGKIATRQNRLVEIKNRQKRFSMYMKDKIQLHVYMLMYNESESTLAQHIMNSDRTVIKEKCTDHSVGDLEYFWEHTVLPILLIFHEKMNTLLINKTIQNDFIKCQDKGFFFQTILLSNDKL